MYIISENENHWPLYIKTAPEVAHEVIHNPATSLITKKERIAFNSKFQLVITIVVIQTQIEGVILKVMK